MPQTPTWYKQTDIWVIPSDWEALELLKIAPLQRWFDIINNSIRRWPYPIVYSNWISNHHQTYMVKWPGVITWRSGTLWKVHYVTDNYRPHNTSLWVTNFHNNYPLYIFYLYTYIWFDRFGTWSGVPTLNRNDAHNFRIAIPQNKKEQQAIATALSDIDTCISKLDALITKQQQFKKGTMQQLLTGKKRLPGFDGEWEEVKLWEICSMQAGKSKSQFVHRWWKYVIMDMWSVSTDWKVIDSKKSNLLQDILELWDLVMPKDDIWWGFIIWKTAYINQENKYILWDHVYRLFNFSENSLFISYLINSDFVNSQIKKKVSWSAQLWINKQSVYEQELIIPKDPKEQQAIAQVLSDIDTHIQNLQTKKKKYEKIKLWMMQKLLTGQIRLV